MASALRIGNPANWQRAVRARDDSGGLIETVSDPEILESYQLLAECEGVFAEPASAASVAGVLKLAAAGEVKPTDQIVCVLTGHGLKDPQIALDVAKDVVPPPMTCARSRRYSLCDDCRRACAGRMTRHLPRIRWTYTHSVLRHGKGLSEAC